MTIGCEIEGLENSIVTSSKPERRDRDSLAPQSAKELVRARQVPAALVHAPDLKLCSRAEYTRVNERVRLKLELRDIFPFNQGWC